MANYLKINEHTTKNVELAISDKVFERIATNAAKKMMKKHPDDVRMPSPVKVSFKGENQVTIKVSISIRKGVKLSSISYEIQTEIARALEVYVESVPFDIDVSIVEFKK